MDERSAGHPGSEAVDAAGVLLLHSGHPREGERHYDWLFEHPGRLGTETAPPLWGGRVVVPTWEWPTAERFTLWVQPDHRRRYLEYEGEVSGGRGVVRRVDSGVVRVLRWEPAAGIASLRIAFERVHGALMLRGDFSDRIDAFWRG